MQSNLLKTKTLADNSRRTDSGFRVRMTSDLRYFRVIKREIGSHFHWVATRTAVGKRSPERDLELSHICGAKLSPLFSTYPIANTPVAAPRSSYGSFVNLPILTRISLSLSPRVPPVSPQCFANAPRTNRRGAFAKHWGETGGTLGDKDKEIRVRMGKFTKEP